MSVSFLRMQWRSRTFVVSVFRCLVSLVCQCRAICCRLRSLKSTTRLSKSHLLGLVPGKKLGSELHAIRLFPFNGRLLSSQIFSCLSGQQRATWMMVMMVVSFSRTTQEAWRIKRMSVRDQWAVWSMIDERWTMIHDAWPRFCQSFGRWSSPFPSIDTSIVDDIEQHERHPPIFNGQSY